MSSLNTAVLQVSYKAWQEIDVSFILSQLNTEAKQEPGWCHESEEEYKYENLLSVSVEGYDVIVKTDDHQEHRLEQIIPDLVIETDQPPRLDLFVVSGSGKHTSFCRKANTLPSAGQTVLKLGGCE